MGGCVAKLSSCPMLVSLVCICPQCHCDIFMSLSCVPCVLSCPCDPSLCPHIPVPVSPCPTPVSPYPHPCVPMSHPCVLMSHLYVPMSHPCVPMSPPHVPAPGDSTVPVPSWSGSHLRWGQPFRLRHVTTGRYLALTEAAGLAMVEASAANTRVATFCFRASKVGMSPRCPQRGPGPCSDPVLVPVLTPVPVPTSLGCPQLSPTGFWSLFWSCPHPCPCSIVSGMSPAGSWSLS